MLTESLRKGTDLAFRFLPSALLFGLTKLISIATGEVSDRAFDILILYPVLMPIFRIGIPLQILENPEKHKPSDLGIHTLLSGTGALFFLCMYAITATTIFLTIALGLLGAISYNLGTTFISKGSRIGYLLYNGPVYLALIFYLFYPNSALVSLVGSAIIITLSTLKFGKFILLSTGWSIRWLNDVLGAIILPFSIFTIVSTFNSLGPNEFLTIKICSMLSASVSTLIILRINRSRSEGKLRSHFIRIRNSMLPIGIVGFLALAGASLIISGTSVLYLTLFVLSLEIIALRFGQYNLLNILSGNQLAILQSSAITCAFSLLMFVTFQTGFVADTVFVGMLSYACLITIWHILSYTTASNA